MITETVERAQAGDEQAYAELYRENKARVHGLCWQMTRNADDADDLTQESFAHAFRKLKQFRGESAFSTWLHRVTVRVVLMSRRRSKYYPGIVSLDEPVTDDGKMLDIGAEDPALRSAGDGERIVRAMRRLPSGMRAVFVFHDIFGYTHTEVAEISGFSRSNSKSHLHRARMKMREMLKCQRVQNRPDSCWP
jgi:RNA polymerase sigma-70 factor (ECF subfamily)